MRKRLDIRSCYVCNLHFQPKRSEQIICSVACSKKRKRLNNFRSDSRYCRICLGLYRPAFHVKKGTCSLECGWILRKLIYPKIKKEKKGKGEKCVTRKPLHQFNCANCHKMVICPANGRRTFCSKKCSELVSWRREKHRRRARKRTGNRGSSIDLPTVLVRDQYKCGICYKRIPKQYKYPHPLSPSLDHIIPLSKGGSHSWDNVQASHHQCNQKKAAIPYGQLRIC